MKKKRNQYAPEEKVAILRRHLLEKEPLSKLFDEVELQRRENSGKFVGSGPREERRGRQALSLGWRTLVNATAFSEI